MFLQFVRAKSTALAAPTVAYKTSEWVTEAIKNAVDPMITGKAKAWINSIVGVTTLSVGLALGARVNEAQAQNAVIVCDPAIAATAMRRYLGNIKLDKAANLPVDLAAREKSMNDRVRSLCDLDVMKQEYLQAAADRQAAAAIIANAQRKEQAAETILATTLTKEQRIALEEKTAYYIQASSIVKKVEVGSHTKEDIVRLHFLYKGIAQAASTKEKEQNLPAIASLLRKLGVAVNELN